MQASKESNRLSVSDCESSRRRVPPRASRTELSLLRLRSRATNRLVTLADAMSRTMAATPATQSAVRASRDGSGPALSFSDERIAPGRASSIEGMSGSWTRLRFHVRAADCVASAVACSRLTPGLRRTIISTQRHE
jgi:hypothetical protein